MSDAALSERGAAAVEDSAPSDAMKPAAGETRRGGRADMGNSGAMKLVKIAAAEAAEAAVESAAGKTGDDGRRAGVEIGRWVYAAYAKAMQAWTTAEGAMQTSGRRSAAGT